ncbi:immunity protein YezG family protein [Staphylococcus aureus]
MIPVEWEKVYTMAYIDDGCYKCVNYYHCSICTV